LTGRVGVGWYGALVNDRLLAWVRIGFGLLVLAAIGYQAWSLIEAGVFDPTRFFLFFTILSNLLAAGVFLEGGRRQMTGASPVPDVWRGLAVVVMTVTFIVFAVLLRGLQEELQTNIVWVDSVLHRVMPVAVMADWLIEPPHVPLTFRRALVPWLGPPLVWTAFTMVRGAIDGWYPYPFLDPANGGYGFVALYAVAILVLLLGVIWLVATVGTALRERRR
jgi:hypothetical protein